VVGDVVDLLGERPVNRRAVERVELFLCGDAVHWVLVWGQTLRV